MEKAWLGQYQDGVPSEVDLHQFASLADFIEGTCRRYAALPAFGNMGASITYGRLERDSRAFAGYLRSLGLEKGARVALMMPNLLQYPVVLCGVLRAGLTVVNVNPLYTERELVHQLHDAGATAIVVLENVAHTLQRVLPDTQVKHVITTQVGDMLPRPKAQLVNFVVKRLKRLVPPWHIQGATSFRAALQKGRRHPLGDIRLCTEDIAFLQYTGGTTGSAKGAVLSHGNVLANIQQMSAWIAATMREGQDVAVIPLPLYHVYALTCVLVFAKFGAHCVLVTNPRDMPSFLSTLKASRPTAIIGVNTLYRALLDAPGFAPADFGRLRLTSAGGMAIQRVVADRWKQATGVPIVEGYGLSETSPVVISNRLDIKDWTGFIGLPIPSTEATVRNEQGDPVPVGEVGEICVRGPQVMKTYWNRPDESERAFTPDGWFRTGDMGVMNEQGYFKITDRKKDMIIVSGFKVFPNEVEDVVMLHPGVAEAAAIGVPDAKSGESVKVVVVKQDPSLTAEALRAHCEKNLAGYKVPKTFEFRSEPLPKSAIGKVLRRQLRNDAIVPREENKPVHAPRTHARSSGPR